MKDDLVDSFLKEIMLFQRAGFLKMLNTKNLNTSEVHILYVMYRLISDQGKIMLATIRDALQLAPSTTTSIMTSLEEKELIERIIDKEDRRNICINITKKGERYIEKIEDNKRKMISRYIDYMGEEDIIRFKELISKTTKFVNENKFLGEE